MRKSKIVEQLHKHEIIGNEGTIDEWIWEVINWNCVVVYADFRVHIELLFLNFLFGSVGLSKCSNFKTTIVIVSNCILITCSILLNLLQLDIIFFLTSNDLLKHHEVGLQVVLLNKVGLIILPGHSDCTP